MVGVRPVDQDSPETQLPAVTAKAVKRADEDFVRVALSTDEVVPVHQSEGADKGAWVGVAFQAPKNYEGGTFHYAFGTEASDEASQSTSVTENPAIGEGKYAPRPTSPSSGTAGRRCATRWICPASGWTSRS